MKKWALSHGYWCDLKSLWQKWTLLPFKTTDEYRYCDFSKITIFGDIYAEILVSRVQFFVGFWLFFLECGIRIAISANPFGLVEKSTAARSFCWSGSWNRLPELGERVENVFHMLAMLVIEGFLLCKERNSMANMRNTFSTRSPSSGNRF